MRDLIPWSRINPGGHDPKTDKLHPDVRAAWDFIRPTLNFFILLSVVVIIAIAGIFAVSYFQSP